MASDYISFYSQHVKDLKKEGKQYLGCCPFHSDEGSKLRGFSVNPDNGLWKCFSCDARGNAIKFCQKRGIDVKEAPDYSPNYQKYSYGAGIAKMKLTSKAKDRGTASLWEGTEKKGLPDDMPPYNYQAIDEARKSGKTLWICEGEKDTLTMFEAGEFAIGIPSASTDKVLDAVSLDGIHKVVIACDNDAAGEKATERILKRFPWAKKIEWPPDKPKGYDVTDLKGEYAGNEFINELNILAVDNDPFYPLTETLMDKYERDYARDPDRPLGYELQKFKTLSKNIDGVQPGFYVVAAETNAGKTAFLCNLTLDLLDSTPELTGIYFSLDDNKDTILNRFLSINTGIPLNQVQRKQQYEKQEKMLSDGYSYLTKLAEERRLSIRDASEIADIDDLELEIKRRMNRNLFVVIDGLYNLDVGSQGADTRKENIERANKLKNLADIYRIPVICTGELRKKERGAGADRSPSIDDLMETGKFAYNANLVLLIYPEAWENYNSEDEPTLNLKYAKNKLSHVRTTGKIKFIRKTSQIEESE
jgi:hypothetical protein